MNTRVQQAVRVFFFKGDKDVSQQKNIIRSTITICQLLLLIVVKLIFDIDNTTRAHKNLYTKYAYAMICNCTRYVYILL